MYSSLMLMCRYYASAPNQIFQTVFEESRHHLVRDTSLLTTLSSTYPELRLGSRNSTSLLRTSLTLLLLLTLRLLALGSS
jgi:hypothetical protein